jgi:hypothetical protein
VIIGFVALGSLSPSEPVATETSTTTTTTIEEIQGPVDPESFTVAQIATGEPLEWERVQTLDPGHPLEIIDHSGRLFIFATATPPWTGQPGGLIVWESTDGENWSRVGQVISDEFRVTAVAGTQQGLVAAGARPGGRDLIVWQSEDASNWTATEIATDADGPYQAPLATGVAATSDTIVVSAEIEIDRDGVVEDHLREAGVDVDMSEATWTTRYTAEDGLELSVYGPLVTPGITIALNELDLTDRERRWLTEGADQDGRSSVWVIDDAGGWQVSTIPLSHVTELLGRQTGGFLALGRGGAEITAGVVSSDGVTWSPIATGTTPMRAANRETFLVGAAWRLTPELLYSMLGGTWREMGVAEEFPSVADWSPSVFGGGTEGVALVVQGREETAKPLASERGETTVTGSGGITLTLDYERRVFVLEENGSTHTWEMPGPGADETPGGLDVDLEDEVVVFRDPHDGERLATFTFEQLQQAETRFRSARFSEAFQPQHHALVLNTGALEWEIKDLSAVVGDGQVVRLITVGSDHVVVVTDEAVILEKSPPGFEIWSAPLP